MPAVVEAEVARHAGEHDAVRLPQRLPALMMHLQRVIAPEQAARHAGEIHRHPEPGDSGGDAWRVGGEHEGLAADDDEWPLSLGKARGGRVDTRSARGRRRDRRARGGRASPLPANILATWRSR